MKKTYSTPTAEKIEFNYKEQVVASGTGDCGDQYSNVTGEAGCAKIPNTGYGYNA